jgi:hypothetical protein
MKKRLIALILVIVLCISLTSCGTDYKKLGYDYMKQSTAEQYPNGIDDDTKASFAMGAALFGRDSLCALVYAEIDGLSKDELKDTFDGKDISDDEFETFKEGCKEYMKEFLDEVIPDTSEQ